MPTQSHLASPKIPEKELTEPYVPISLRRRQPRDLFEYAIVVEEEEGEESDDEMEVKLEPVELHLIEGEDFHVEDEDDDLDDEEVFIEVRFHSSSAPPVFVGVISFPPSLSR